MEEKIKFLVKATLEGLYDPRVFENVTGVSQKIDKLYQAHKLSWIEIWVQLYPILPKMEPF